MTDSPCPRSAAMTASDSRAPRSSSSNCKTSGECVMVPSLSFNVVSSRMGGAEEMGEVTVTRGCNTAHNFTAMPLKLVHAPARLMRSLMPRALSRPMLHDDCEPFWAALLSAREPDSCPRFGCCDAPYYRGQFGPTACPLFGCCDAPYYRGQFGPTACPLFGCCDAPYYRGQFGPTACPLFGCCDAPYYRGQFGPTACPLFGCCAFPISTLTPSLDGHGHAQEAARDARDGLFRDPLALVLGAQQLHRAHQAAR